ncbi:MAG: phytoene desaturase family protein [Deinococcaceae bacterium]
MKRRTAIVIGAGFGGLAMGLRLQSLGFDTTVLEQRDAPGGRAYVHKAQGFTFDMGPTVVTVPQFIEELFSLQRDDPQLSGPDFPEMSDSTHTAKYVNLVPVFPFYRIYFSDGTYFDYDGDIQRTKDQIAMLAPEDVLGYERFLEDARAIFERGFLELGYTYFGSLTSALKVIPDLLKLDAVRSLFSFTCKYFKSDKMRQIFSFETLLIGGNPLTVPALYAMIHFVEKTWGVHFTMGGTGALVGALVRKYEELGGTLRLSAEVKNIHVNQKRVTGVTLASGEQLDADVVVCNSDWAYTQLNLIDPKHRRINSNTRVRLTRQSMSLVVIYFGFKADGREAEHFRHHNIILGPRYEGLLKDIFDRKALARDFSQYLHIPTLTDPSLAPEGYHAAYTLIPVPNNTSRLDWDLIGSDFVDRILNMLETQSHLPNLRERLVYRHFVTPDYFEHTLLSHQGNAFGVEPLLTQSAFFRPHNRSEDIENLYFVGANTQPGAGMPSVMMSAKMTARIIAQDQNISPGEITDKMMMT